MSAGSLVHFYGGGIRIDGVVEATEGTSAKILLNSAGNLTITGVLDSTGDIEVNAGVATDLTQARSEAGGFAVANLVGGTIFVSGAAAITAAEEVLFQAGVDFLLGAESVIGADRSLPAPKFVQTPGTVRVFVGSRQVEDGFIEIPRTEYVDTQVLEQVGAEPEVVGVRYHTLGLTLEQDAYYNGTSEREWFIEG
ncbi:MAG: hypothetical protein GY856_30790, partial [bacterium]|nr:hypothetical protein [bacterium]